MVISSDPMAYMAEQKNYEKDHRHCTAWCQDHPCPTQDTWKDEAGKKDLEYKEHQKLGRWFLDSVLDFFIESKAVPKSEIDLNQEKNHKTQLFQPSSLEALHHKPPPLHIGENHETS